MQRSEKSSLYLALFVAFLDNMGVGLIYPLFSSMLFNPTLPLLPLGTSDAMRGVFLGLLISLMPLTQFFSFPFWGALSDNRGRKRPLLISLTVILFSYFLALGGVFLNNISLLLLSRVGIGLGSGNMSIVQAAIADVSAPSQKAKHFGLYGMALGVGFTLGPFFGGLLSKWGYSVPFLFASSLVFLNLIFASKFFRETYVPSEEKKIPWNLSITQIKKAFSLVGARSILLASFLHSFAWSYFFEFIPVYLIARFQFSSTQLGFFYAIAGSIYALSAGYLIRPFIHRFKPEILLFSGNFLTSLTIFSLLFLTSSFWIWPLMALLCFFVAFVSPTSTTLISDYASPQVQGESLGILSSVNAAALTLSPLFSGTLIGSHPSLSMWVGSSFMFFSALMILWAFRGQRLTAE